MNLLQGELIVSEKQNMLALPFLEKEEYGRLVYISGKGPKVLARFAEI